MYDPYANFMSATLSNGLSIHVLHEPQRAGIAMWFGVHSGAHHDTFGREGTAHFVEHMVSNNTTVSATMLTNFFRQNTGRRPMLGMTYADNTRYACFVAPDQAEVAKALEYFGTMLLSARLEQGLEKERGIIQSEWRREFQPNYKKQCKEAILHAVATPTIFGRMLNPIGHLSVVTEMTEDILQQYYDQHYVPKNISVVVVGEWTLEQVVRAFENSPFAVKKEGERAARALAITHVPEPNSTFIHRREGIAILGEDGAEYESLALLPPMGASAAFHLFEQIFDQVFFEEVREQRGLTYSLGSDAVHMCTGTLFVIVCEKVISSAIYDLDPVIQSCIERVAEDPALLEDVKQQTILQTRFRERKMGQIGHNALQDVLYTESISSLEEDLREIAAVQQSDMQNIARFLIRPQRCVMIREA